MPPRLAARRLARRRGPAPQRAARHSLRCPLSVAASTGPSWSKDLEHELGPGTPAEPPTPSRSFRKGLVPGSPGLGAAVAATAAAQPSDLASRRACGGMGGCGRCLEEAGFGSGRAVLGGPAGYLQGTLYVVLLNRNGCAAVIFDINLSLQLSCSSK